MRQQRINLLQEGPDVDDKEPATSTILIQKETQLKETHVKDQLTAKKSDNI